MTVLETPGFLRDAAAALTEAERLQVVTYSRHEPGSGRCDVRARAEGASFAGEPPEGGSAAEFE